MPLALLKKKDDQWDLFDESTLDHCVDCTNRVIQQLKSHSDRLLISAAAELSERVQGNPPIDDPEILTVALGLISESLFRETGMRLHAVQLRGAIVCAAGHIAEMQTGEGKTLVTAAAAFVQSITRRGVHVATTNAYLTQRDFEKIAPAITRLGFTAACLNEDDRPAATHNKYRCDVTYGTGYQFGFDYLRDQVTLRERSVTTLGDSVARSIAGIQDDSDVLRQRGFAMAIIDEADSVLIDEATVPLVLSSRIPGNTSQAAYALANEAIRILEAGTDFPDDLEEPIRLSTAANVRIHAWLKGRTVPQLLRPWTKYIENALQANFRLACDQHYVIQDNQVRIVDQNTGRIFTDRSWRDGLHQAVEAREGVPIRPDDTSSSRITRQRFFQLYDRIAGLTGTAADASRELLHFYKLPVVAIPTNVPGKRITLPGRFFANSEAKMKAIADSAAQYHAAARPVLIGTPTIEQSKLVAAQLANLGLPHVVLNGTQGDDEADLVGAAGTTKSIMVATNMAGRGTDIKPCPEAIKLGGLHVIASEYAKSQRIDRQLLGRSARQGDPGSCQFFACPEDELIAKEPSLAGKMRAAADASGETAGNFESKVSDLQDRLEKEGFEMRVLSVQSDAWFDSVREALN